jgi:hypothetical protein
MTARGTLVLWTLVGALGLYLWASARAPGGRTPEPPPAPPLLRFDPGAVTTLTITDAGASTTLVRRGGLWAPARGGRKVRAEAVDGLVATLASLSPLAVLESGGDLAAYGLDRPRWEIRLAAPGHDGPLGLAIGDDNPAGTGVYVRRLDGGDALLVGAVIRWEAEKLVRALRQGEP